MYQLKSSREVLEVRGLLGEHGGEKGKEGRRGPEGEVLMGNFTELCRIPGFMGCLPAC